MAKAMQAPYGLMREFLEEHNYISSSNLGGGTTLRLGLPTGSTSLGADSGGTSIDTSAGSSRVSSCGSISHFSSSMYGLILSTVLSMTVSSNRFWSFYFAPSL